MAMEFCKICLATIMHDESNICMGVNHPGNLKNYPTRLQSQINEIMSSAFMDVVAFTQRNFLVDTELTELVKETERKILTLKALNGID